MNVFYEEQGEFKVGTVLADNDTSLQVETAHGKRAKIKSSAVLLRFDAPPVSAFMSEAGKVSDTLDVDFLWECCGEDEFGFDTLAREYFGRPPSAVEAAGLVQRLHSAPMYFYRRGKGRFKAAPEEALKAALAGIEKKKKLAEQQAHYVAELNALRLPPEFVPLASRLLYRPERNSVEGKALEEACEALKLTPARLFEKCGALPSAHDYHYGRFVFEYFPRGTGFADLPAVSAPEALVDAAVAAFSIDDAATTEIDDAFSVEWLEGGAVRVGIHIAAPALGIAPGSPVDLVARERLSTVYMPGRKITMLPGQAIEAFTLGAGSRRPALSLYADLSPDLEVLATRTAIERVDVVENLRHDVLEPLFDEHSVARGEVAHPLGRELLLLHRFAERRQIARGKAGETQTRAEYNFIVDGEHVEIVERARGSPLDKLVAELMIFANSHWGARLDSAGVAGVFRTQREGRVKLTTAAARHDGLGVSHYIWASSPLRRYVDLINQRQLIALARIETPPYRRNDEALLAAMRDFELAYDAYADHQRQMERYWCLRWLQQEKVETLTATMLRDGLVRFERLPLTLRVPSTPELPMGARVELAVTAIDLLDLRLECEFRRALPGGAEMQAV